MYESKFGTGKLLGGSTKEEGDNQMMEEMALMMSHTEKSEIKMDFLSSEAYGVEVPKRCSLCKGCKECNFKNTQISFEELTELTAIENNKSLNVAERKWKAEYVYK